MKDGSGDLLEPREDVPSGGSVLACHAPRAKLTGREEEVDVVRSNVVLSHSDDGAVERRLTVVVRRVLADVARQLSDLDLALQLLLEAGVEHLALRGLEAVHDVRDRAVVVVLAEKHELAVDEVGVVDAVRLRLAVVEVRVLLDGVEPLFAVLDLALREGHVNEAGARGDRSIVLLHVIKVAGHDVGAQLVEVNLVDVEV